LLAPWLENILNPPINGFMSVMLQPRRQIWRGAASQAAALRRRLWHESKNWRLLGIGDPLIFAEKTRKRKVVITDI
jgi:hypothetical protein